MRLIGADTPVNLAALAPKLVDEVVEFDIHHSGIARAWAAGRGDGVNAVLMFREMCVESVAAIADEFCIAGNDPATVHTIRTKDLCRELLRAAGFRQPRCTIVTDEESALRFLAETRPGPWIVKPRDGMGSTSVFLVDRPDGLAVAVGKLVPGVPFLVETFVSGPEFSAECTARRGADRTRADRQDHRPRLRRDRTPRAGGVG